MSKTPAALVILATLGLVAPALAVPQAKAAPTKVKQLNCGDKYIVGHEVEHSALTQAQIDGVMKAKLGEVTACWNRLPATQRKKDTNAVLKLAIDDGGEVQTVDVAGIPDDAARCIAKAAVAWTFPQTETQAEPASYAYPVVLRAN